MQQEFKFIPYRFDRLDEAEMVRRGREFHSRMSQRRSIREFSPEPIPMSVIETAIRTAGTAPSGANKQPWFFCIIEDPEIKHRIRLAAEEEESTNYEGRFTREWLEALAPFGTDANKEYLETAPVLIVVFKQTYEPTETGKRKNYYVNESVGMAMGLLIAALHTAGLAALTHTPNPMGFLNRILDRPGNETPVVIIPTGYPKQGCTVPDIRKKSPDEIMKNY